MRVVRGVERAAEGAEERAKLVLIASGSRRDGCVAQCARTPDNPRMARPCSATDWETSKAFVTREPARSSFIGRLWLGALNPAVFLVGHGRCFGARRDFNQGLPMKTQTITNTSQLIRALNEVFADIEGNGPRVATLESARRS
jgi:hypothetical protein